MSKLFSFSQTILLIIQMKNKIILNLLSKGGILINLFSILFFIYSCDKNTSMDNCPNVTETVSLEIPPPSVVRAIKENFEGAVPFDVGIDSLLDQLNKYGLPAKSMLWGQSTCVDDIINTKNKLNPEIKGPFNFGGLAGLPFTGITGIDAFAHHVPEDGTAILFVGPHIGYNEKAGWGKILRHNQKHPSSCCGALTAALAKLQKGELKSQLPNQNDYQEGMIEQMVLASRKEILSSKEPLISLTKLTHLESLRQISIYASQAKERHFKYAVIVSGIIINTDYRYTDYLWIEKISILDINKNEWIEGEKF